MENSKKPVKIPHGYCCYGTCGECLWSHPDEKDKYGKIWCERNHAYYYSYESSSGCTGYRTRR